MKIKIEFDTKSLKDPLIILKIVSIIFLVVSSVYFKIDLVNTIIALYFLIAILFSIKSQYSFYIGLFFLLLTAFLYSIGFGRIAENYAVYAFYFLFIGITTAIIEAAKKKDQ